MPLVRSFSLARNVYDGKLAQLNFCRRLDQLHVLIWMRPRALCVLCRLLAAQRLRANLVVMLGVLVAEAVVLQVHVTLQHGGAGIRVTSVLRGAGLHAFVRRASSWGQGKGAQARVKSLGKTRRPAWRPAGNWAEGWLLGAHHSALAGMSGLLRRLCRSRTVLGYLPARTDSNPL